MGRTAGRDRGAAAAVPAGLRKQQHHRAEPADQVTECDHDGACKLPLHVQLFAGRLRVRCERRRPDVRRQRIPADDRRRCRRRRAQRPDPPGAHSEVLEIRRSVAQRVCRPGGSGLHQRRARSATAGRYRRRRPHRRGGPVPETVDGVSGGPLAAVPVQRSGVRGGSGHHGWRRRHRRRCHGPGVLRRPRRQRAARLRLGTAATADGGFGPWCFRLNTGVTGAGGSRPRWIPPDAEQRATGQQTTSWWTRDGDGRTELITMDSPTDDIEPPFAQAGWGGWGLVAKPPTACRTSARTSGPLVYPTSVTSTATASKTRSPL